MTVIPGIANHFENYIESGDVKALRPLACSPNLNAFLERYINPTIHTRERLGSLLKYYHLEAA